MLTTHRSIVHSTLLLACLRLHHRVCLTVSLAFLSVIVILLQMMQLVINDSSTTHARAHDASHTRKLRIPKAARDRVIDWNNSASSKC
jgi:hypothetical protein